MWCISQSQHSVTGQNNLAGPLNQRLYITSIMNAILLPLTYHIVWPLSHNYGCGVGGSDGWGFSDIPTKVCNATTSVMMLLSSGLFKWCIQKILANLIRGTSCYQSEIVDNFKLWQGNSVPCSSLAVADLQIWHVGGGPLKIELHRGIVELTTICSLKCPWECLFALCSKGKGETIVTINQKRA